MTALELRGQLSEACVDGDASQRSTPEQDTKICELLTKIADLAERCREHTCLLIHEDTLSYVTALVRSRSFGQSVVAACSSLIMALLNYRVHENARDYEK